MRGLKDCGTENFTWLHGAICLPQGSMSALSNIHLSSSGRSSISGLRKNYCRPSGFYTSDCPLPTLTTPFSHKSSPHFHLSQLPTVSIYLQAQKASASVAQLLPHPLSSTTLSPVSFRKTCMLPTLDTVLHCRSDPTPTATQDATPKKITTHHPQLSPISSIAHSRSLLSPTLATHMMSLLNFEPVTSLI